MHSPFFKIAALVVIVSLVAPTGSGQVILPTCPDQAPDAFLKWAKQTAVPLASTGSPNDFRDLRSLRKAIGEARVVGLGEAARRVQEFYEVRTRLLKYLVEELGFTGLAMETGFAEAIKTNDYVLGRIGEPANWQDWFTFGYGDELETQAMLRWMRQYNQDSHHVRKIHFYGVDVMVPYSSPETALNVTFTYLDKVDPAFVSSPTRRDLEDLVHKFLGSGSTRANMEKSFKAYAKLASTDRNEYTAAIRGLLARFEDNRVDYIGRSSEEAYEWARHAAVAARQLDTTYRADLAGAQPGEQFEAVNPVSIWEARDAAMLENLTWALQQEGKSGRLMLWAHNAHISKGSVPSSRSDVVGLWEQGPRLGLLLNKALVESYFSIGTTFYGGKPGWQSARESAACGTVGGELARISGSAFSLDIRSNRKDTKSLAWLDKPRIMPADTPTSDYRVVPSQAWDAMVFIRHITPVRVVVTK
jgi:erythromycin esterase